MAESALHPTAMLLPILMAGQADGRAPLGQPCLIRLAVAHGARCHVSHVPAVVPLGISGMTEPAVGGGLVVKGVTCCTHFAAPGRTGTLVAGRTIETHGSVGLMQEAPHFSWKGVQGYPFVAEAAIHGRRVVKAMAAITGLFLHRHGGSLMAGVTSKSHGKMGIVKEASPGEGDGVPGRRVMTKTASSR